MEKKRPAQAEAPMRVLTVRLREEHLAFLRDRAAEEESTISSIVRRTIARMAREGRGGTHGPVR